MSQRVYCLKCKKEIIDCDNKEEVQICNCGSKQFVFGEEKSFNFDKDGNIVCKCGGNAFKETMHLDYTNRYSTTYICAKPGCNTIIGVEGYRNKDDCMNEE
jgi:hypothetical protein